MAAAKLVALLLLALLFTTSVFADAGIGSDEPEIVEAAGSDGSSKIQLDQLHAKIRVLESEIDEKTREVKGKDELAQQRKRNFSKKGKTRMPCTGTGTTGSVVMSLVRLKFSSIPYPCPNGENPPLLPTGGG